MNISQTDICNRVLSEANRIPESGFPLDCFPAKVQSIILDMVSHENYKVEYIATSMLSAVATALGNSYRIHIKGGWNSNSALYIILVGRPGLGKTPPLEAAFKPIRKRDNELLEKFKSEMAAYQAEKEKKGKGESKELLLSAKNQKVSNNVSAVPINRYCGFIFQKVSPPFRQRASLLAVTIQILPVFSSSLSLGIQRRNMGLRSTSA